MGVIQRILPKSPIGRSVVVLMGGTAAAQIITAASMPVITRLYSPELIGVISIYLSFFNFWNTILTWRYESALLVTEDEEESHHVFRLGALLAFLTSLMSIPVLASLQHIGLLGFDVLPLWAPIVAFFSLLGFGWFMLYRAWLLRLREAKVISISAVARSGANAGTRILTGLLNVGVQGLFIAEIVGSWSALGSVRMRTKNLLHSPSPAWSGEEIKRVGLRYKKFAQYEMPSSVLNQLAIALPVPIVGAMYGAEAAGWFGLARLLYAIPNGQIGKTAGDVFQMELGSLVRQKKYQEGERLFYQFLFRLMFLGLAALILAIFAVPPLVPLIFGTEWQEMGIIVAHMAPWMFMSLVVGSMGRALSVLQMQQWKMLYDLYSLSLILVVYLIGVKTETDIIRFIDYLSAAMVSSYLVYLFIIIWVMRNMRRAVENKI